MTSVAGHIFSRDFPTSFQDWNKDPASLFHAPTVRKLEKQSRAVATNLAGVSKNMDFMVLWLDCDKEGENICFEVLDVCKRNIPKVRITPSLILCRARKSSAFIAQSSHRLRPRIFSKLSLISRQNHHSMRVYRLMHVKCLI